MVAAHNSVDVIAATVHQLAQRLAGIDSEIIVVENGSRDATLAVCEDLIANWNRGGTTLRVLSSAKGMGRALRLGVLASGGARVLLTADDLPFGFDDLDADAAFGAHPPPVLVGSKAHADSVIERGLIRTLLTYGFFLLRCVVLHLHTRDPQGTFVVDGALLRQLVPALREPGFLFTTELAYALELRGIRPHEIPVHLRAEHAAHGTRISTADVLGMALGLLRLRRRRAALMSGYAEAP